MFGYSAESLQEVKTVNRQKELEPQNKYKT